MLNIQVLKRICKTVFSLFIVLLGFRESLARDRTKCLFLNDEPCMVRPTLVDMIYSYSYQSCWA